MKTIKSILAVFTVALMIASCEKDKVEKIASPISDQTTPPMPEESNERSLGCVLLSEAEYSKIEKAPEETTPLTLPTSYYLTCPQIRSQGSEGSCVGWGTAYAARSIAHRNYYGGSFNNSVNLFSPEFVYNQIKIGTSCSSGAKIVDALKLMKNKGVCTWTKMPYSSTNGCSLLPNSTQLANATTHKISNYTTASRYVSDIKNRLATHHQPVIIGGPVDQAFLNLGYNQIYTHYSGNSLGGHCYCVVGYSDTKQAFKIMNSWGSTWGTHGFGWIAYAAVNTTFWSEAYVLYN